MTRICQSWSWMMIRVFSRFFVWVGRETMYESSGNKQFLNEDLQLPFQMRSPFFPPYGKFLAGIYKKSELEYFMTGAEWCYFITKKKMDYLARQSFNFSSPFFVRLKEFLQLWSCGKGERVHTTIGWQIWQLNWVCI